MSEEKKVSTQWLGRNLSIRTGKLARQADACVTVQYGETVVMATVVESKEEKNVDFFPLSVALEEKLYAAGIIKGSRWIKREGRPTDDAVLTGRMIDRSIRPLFNEDSRRETQVMITVLSVDKENHHDIVSLIAASAALSISGVDWKGPIGGIRVGKKDDKLIFNPTYQEMEENNLNLIVAGTKEKTIMIEAGANELKEEEVYQAITQGQTEMQPAVKLIEELKNKTETKTKPAKEKTLSEEEEKEKERLKEIAQIAEKWLEENINPILFNKEYYSKGERKAAVEAIKNQLNQHLIEQNLEENDRKYALKKTVEPMVEAEVSKQILQKEKRVDGRTLDDIRKLSSEVGILPRNHGAGLFSRGETQIMSIVTLGSPGLEQYTETLEGMGTKRFMHHYNFPPYSVGEAKPIFGPGRREIGHGALAEKALFPVIPDKEEFPYIVRVVSETLSSNGSSSMGSTCAASLALMDAGVPIKKAVGGIAMGLASNQDMSEWKVLTDIQDLEDGKGGMDFKITGTEDGITAVQLDTKTNGLTEEIIKETLKKGKKARLRILENMNKAIKEPRAELSPYAPLLLKIKIKPEKIRDVIGAGGKMINKIIEEKDVSIDIEEDGTVIVSGSEKQNCEEAINWIKKITYEFEVGEIFTGKVVRITDFGIFVSLFLDHEGLVHVSEMAPFRVNHPKDIVKEGDEVKVKIKNIDEQGKIALTMKDLEENKKFWQKEKNNSGPKFNNKPPFNSRKQ